MTYEIISDGKATHGLLGAMVGDGPRRRTPRWWARTSSTSPWRCCSLRGPEEGRHRHLVQRVPDHQRHRPTAQVRALAAGSTAPLVYVRDGKTVSAEVTPAR
ncbi:MAG: hypothetical protein R2692_08125 [Microbacterium sp.]